MKNAKRFHMNLLTLKIKFNQNKQAESLSFPIFRAKKLYYRSLQSLSLDKIENFKRYKHRLNKK